MGSNDAIQDMGNHKAYIQSWIEVLENDPSELFRAIKDAEKITEYVKEKAGLQKVKSLEKEQKDSKASKKHDVDKDENEVNSYHENINPKNLKSNKEKEMQKDKSIDKE